MMAIGSRLWSRGAPVLSEAGPADAGAFAALHGASFRRGWSADEFERLQKTVDTLRDNLIKATAEE